MVEDTKIVEDLEEEEVVVIEEVAEEVTEAAGVEVVVEEETEGEVPLEEEEEETGEEEVLSEVAEVEGRLKSIREHQHSHYTPLSWGHNHSSQRLPQCSRRNPRPR